MLRQPKCTQPTPLTQPAWNAYLHRHFRRPSGARGVQPRGLGVGSGLSARDMVVPLGRNTPPEVLQQQGAQNDWMPAPDTIDPPSSDTMLALVCVAEQIGKMNGHASPGFDCVAAFFIKNAVVVR